MVLGLALRCKAPSQLLLHRRPPTRSFLHRLAGTLSDASLCQREFPRPLLRLPVIASNILRMKM